MDSENVSRETSLEPAGVAATGLRTHAYLLVKDVVRAAKYYVDKLGFRVPQFWGEPPCFCIARFGEAGVMLSEPHEPLTILPNWSQDSFSWDVHVLVDDAKAHYEFCRERGATILIELREAPYQMLEFVVQDADGYAICFGQNL
jgi:uncharacterized glyoxalase superfamily protein PhnB